MRLRFALCTLCLFATTATVRAQTAVTLNVTEDQVRLGNLQRIAAATLRYAQKQNGVLAVTAKDYPQKVSRYTGNFAVFTAPGDPPGTLSYQLNPAMAGANLKTVKQPSKTILLFFGKGAKPELPKGKALIAFADGKCRAVNAAELKQLLWKP